MSRRAVLPASVLVVLCACGAKINPVHVGDVPVQAGLTTYCRDVKPVLDTWCGGCHAASLGGAARHGAPAGVDFDTYAGASASATAVRMRIGNGTMPPGGGVPASDLGVIVGWIEDGKPDCPAGGDDPGTTLDVPVPADTNVADPGAADAAAAETSSGATSYCRDLAPILADRCTSCHATSRTGASRNGAPAGVDFDTYAVTVQSADRGNVRVQAGSMPPGAPIPAGEKAVFQSWMDDGKQDCPDPASDATGPDAAVPDVPVADVPPVACSTGKYWSGEEGPTMHPGGNCIACHASGDDGEGPQPDLIVAGTVMGAISDVDDCYGVAGVKVILTPKTGPAVELTTNSTGNFLAYRAQQAIATPYTVRLESGDRQRAMSASQTDTNCMNCHTRYGANYAPGRILVP